MILSRGNVGEKDELVLVETLISLKGEFVESIGETIGSVKTYYGREYSVGTTRTQIAKTPTNAKRDVMINNSGYSLKSTRAAPPAIVNHTTREKWIRVCKKLGVQIVALDEMITEYWELRTQGTFGEDVKVSSTACPFGNNKKRKEYLKTLINYFLFCGTGTQDSPYPADYILEFSDPSDHSSWRVLDKDSAFDLLWLKMVFSVRSKRGMPSNYPNINPRKKALIDPWVKYIDGAYRGALHIRARK